MHILLAPFASWVPWDPEDPRTYRLLSIDTFTSMYTSPYTRGWHEYEDNIHYFVIGGNHCRESWARFLVQDPEFVMSHDPRFTGRVFCELNQSEAHVVNVFIVITICGFLSLQLQL
jgi:hypothetical protein